MEANALVTISIFLWVNNFIKGGYGLRLKRRRQISFDVGTVNERNNSEYGNEIKSKGLVLNILISASAIPALIILFLNSSFILKFNIFINLLHSNSYYN